MSVSKMQMRTFAAEEQQGRKMPDKQYCYTGAAMAIVWGKINDDRVPFFIFGSPPCEIVFHSPHIAVRPLFVKIEWQKYFLYVSTCKFQISTDPQ
jgi:hypothetical protein